MQLKSDLDPEKKVTVHVFDKRNAGKAPGTRWGKVAFDADGYGEVKVLPSALEGLNELGWLTPEAIAEFFDVEVQHAAPAAGLQFDPTLYAARIQELESHLADGMAIMQQNVQRIHELESEKQALQAKHESDLHALRNELSAGSLQLEKSLHAAQAEIAELTKKLESKGKR